MIYKIRLLVIVVMALLVYGCATENQMSYNYAPPDTVEGKTCVAQCHQSRELCETHCNAKSNDNECVAQAQEQGQLKYHEYVSQHQASGEPMDRTLASFVDTRQCRTLSCNCEADYNACYQLCGGTLMPQ